MIGYYVHHVGAGHLNRARAVALRAEVTVTGLSSLPMPADWPGPWVQLERDDAVQRPSTRRREGTCTGFPNGTTACAAGWLRCRRGWRPHDPASSS